MKTLLATLFACMALSASAQSILRNDFTTNNNDNARQVVTNIANSVAGSSNAWLLNGNAIAGSNFLGTLNGNPVVIKQNGSELLRLEIQWTNQVPAITLGMVNTNVNSSGSSILGGSSNVIDGWNPFSVIGGGRSNQMVSVTNASFGHISQGYNVIGGGASNIIDGLFSGGVFIGGGYYNRIYDQAADQAVIAGGILNVSSNAANSFIGGGIENALLHGANYAVISGGYQNTNRGNAYGTIPGGKNNIVGADYGFAAGNRAEVTNTGSFAWADSTGSTNFSTKVANSFIIKATGGAAINTNHPGTNALKVIGNVDASGFTINGDPLPTGGGSNSVVQSLFNWPPTYIDGGGSYIFYLHFAFYGNVIASEWSSDGATTLAVSVPVNGWVSSSSSQFETHNLILKGAGTNATLLDFPEGIFLDGPEPTVLQTNEVRFITIYHISGHTNWVGKSHSVTNYNTFRN